MYDLLAQSIAEQPARKETNGRLRNLQAELKKLHKEKESLEQKLDMRKKQFYVLVSSASKLQGMLEESEDFNNSIPVEDKSEDTDLNLCLNKFIKMSLFKQFYFKHFGYISYSNRNSSISLNFIANYILLSTIKQIGTAFGNHIYVYIFNGM